MNPSIPLIDERAYERHATDSFERILATLDLKSGPVPLRPVVDVCSIRRVVFGWLPVAGGLSVDEEGFSIHVQARKQEAKQWASWFNCKTDEAGRLPAPIRFTIAHEIAHTFFFQWSGENPVSLIDSSKQQLLPRLETACNRAAAALLLPEGLLRPAVQGRSWTPSLLRDTASTFNVSLMVLLLRLHHLERRKSKLVPPHSMVAVIREGQTGQSIIAYAVGKSAQERLPSSQSRWLDSLQVSTSRFCETFSSWTVELPDRSGVSGAAVNLCDVRLESLGKKPRTALLTASISPVPQFVFSFG